MESRFQNSFVSISNGREKIVINLRKTCLYFLKNEVRLGMRNCAEIFHTMNVNVCSLILLHNFPKVYEIGNCTMLLLCLKRSCAMVYFLIWNYLKKPKHFWNYLNFLAAGLIDQANVLKFTASNISSKIQI